MKENVFMYIYASGLSKSKRKKRKGKKLKSLISLLSDHTFNNPFVSVWIVFLHTLICNSRKHKFRQVLSNLPTVTQLVIHRAEF